MIFRIQEKLPPIYFETIVAILDLFKQSYLGYFKSLGAEIKRDKFIISNSITLIFPSKVAILGLQKALLWLFEEHGVEFQDLCLYTLESFTEIP